MEDNGGGDFSTHRRVWNPPQSPSPLRGGEISPPGTSPRSVVHPVEPVAPYSLHQTLEGFSSLDLNADDLSPRYRSLEEDFRTCPSLPSSSQSGDRVLPFQPRRPYAIGFNWQTDQNRLGNGVDDRSRFRPVDHLRFPVESCPLPLGRINDFPYPSPNLGFASFAPSRGMTTFRMNSCKVPKLSCLRGRAVALAMDHSGSKILQESIGAVESHSEIDVLLPEFMANIGCLMINPFGNFVVQKLIEKSNDQQRNKIVFAVCYNPYQLFNVCLSTHGTRVVQRLLEFVNSGSNLQVAAIVGALTPFTVALSKSSNGHHVIQHCLKHFPDKFIVGIMTEVARSCIDLAMDKSGCCVLQLCVERAKGPIGEFIVREIIINAVTLADDRYGNYVVQHLLLMKMPNVTACLLRSLQHNFMNLSMSKFGSNVMEKCLKLSNDLHVSMIIAELIADPRVKTLLVDPYGNYVVQSALENSKGIVRATLVETIKSSVPMMKSNIFGKKILFLLQKKNLLSSQ